MEKYQIEKKVGDGTFGSVYKALCLSECPQKYVAVKKLKSKYETWNKCASLNEIRALAKLAHPNIVRLFEVIKSKSEVFLVFEFLERNLYQMLKQSHLDLQQIRNVMFQVLQGLFYLHSKKVFHRDLKPENILEQNGIVKIADFGLARNFTDEPPFTDYVSTRWYRAPEILLGSKAYDQSVDIFALGCIFAELIMRFPLFPGKNEMDQLKKILKVLGTPSNESSLSIWRLAKQAKFVLPSFEGQSLSEIISCKDSSAIRLIEKMLQIDPAKRISAAEALSHEFFIVRRPRELKAEEFPARKPAIRQSIEVERRTEGKEKEAMSLNVTQVKLSHRIFDKVEADNSEVFVQEHFEALSPFRPGANLYNILKNNG